MMKRLTIRCTIWLVTVGLMTCCGVAAAQSPTVLYTWNGTGNIHDWVGVGSGQVNETTIENSIPGELTVTELGDPVLGDEGGTILFRDGFNRRLESATATGGLDVTGLEFIEFDVAHNGTGNVNAQYFLQVTPSFTYLWAGSDGALNGPDFSLGPGMNTLQFPIALLTPAQQAYVRTIGLRVRDHFDQGNLTWTISEVRSTGTPLTVRDLATHDVGTSDNGLQGAFANFEVGAILGNMDVGGDGGQNQTGLSQNISGSGSLQWTDLGGDGTVDPSGAAITWGNGTLFDGNSFNERLSDFSNYTHLRFTISATEISTNEGGDLGLQAFFQTGNFDFQVAANTTLPIDGQFHDLVFPLSGVSNRMNTQVFGLNLFAHENDLVINVDRIRYEMIEGVPGDYNEDGTVNAADYTVWRDHMGQMFALPNEALSPGIVDIEDYNYWNQHFGESLLGNGGGSAALASVPEPAAFLIGLFALAGCWLTRRETRW